MLYVLASIVFRLQNVGETFDKTVFQLGVYRLFSNSGYFLFCSIP